MSAPAANLGLIFYMFLIGLELDFSQLKGRVSQTAAISNAGVVLPMAVGLLVALPVYELVAPPVKFLGFALFMGVAMPRPAVYDHAAVVGRVVELGAAEDQAVQYRHLDADRRVGRALRQCRAAAGGEVQVEALSATRTCRVGTDTGARRRRRRRGGTRAPRRARRARRARSYEIRAELPARGGSAGSPGKSSGLPLLG